jgi:hypothetical protein
MERLNLISLICLIGILSAPIAEATLDRADCTFLLLKKLTGTDRVYTIPNTHSVSRLEIAEQNLLRPDVEVQTLNGGQMQLGLRNFKQFKATAETLKHKGFFTFFIPSGEGSALAAGHMNVVIDGSFFDRNLDSQGANAIRSLNLDEFSKLFKHYPYAFAQFYELSEGSVTELAHYFHERTWNYHANTRGFKTSYASAPFRANKPLSEVENCTTFSFSFLEPEWQKRYPGLNQVSSEFGDLELNQAPSRQLVNDTKTISYRGSLFITDHKKFKRGLFSDGLRNDPLGSQLLLAKPAKRLRF